MAREYGNLGDDKKGLQKLANDRRDTYRSEVLKEFAAEMDNHEAKRLPSGGSPLNNLRSLPKEEIKKEKEPTPLDWDERMEKWLRD